MKSTGGTDLLQGQGGFPQQTLRCLEAVLNERLHRGTSEVGLETPSRLTSADIGGAGDIFQCDCLGVMFVNIRQHFLEAYLGVQLYP